VFWEGVQQQQQGHSRAMHEAHCSCCTSCLARSMSAMQGSRTDQEAVLIP
jgi:hypothetical protein